MRPIRVVLADDHPLMRAGIRTEVEKADDITVVGEAGSGEEALALVHRLAPDVLVLDVEMTGLSGVDVARRLQAEASSVQILALSAHDDEQYVFGLLESGAAGYLVKDEVPETLVEAIRGVARGQEGWLSRRVMAKVMKQRRIQVQPGPTVSATLSERERDVLRLVARGLDNQQIGAALFISESTVKSHCNSIYGKLGLRNRVQAAAWAWQHGLGDAASS
jgi:DNA-binding NarL/FixJ family response regulator